jgi:hypothetical protein
MLVLRESNSGLFELRWRGLPPRFLRRLAWFLFFGALLAAPIPVYVLNWGAVSSEAWTIIHVLSAIWWIVFLWISVTVSHSEKYVSLVQVHSDHLDFRWSGRLFFFVGWGRRRLESSPMKFEIGPEGKSAIGITCHSGGEAFPLLVEHCDRRVEALDLIFRWARAAGRQGYRVGRSDPRLLEISLSRKAAGDAQLVPSLHHPPQYELNVLPKTFQEPEIKVSPFDPGSLPNLCPEYQPAEWRPGEHVRFYRPQVERLKVKIVGAVGALGGAALGYFFLSEFVGLRWPATVGASIVAGIGAAAWEWYRGREREVVFDWMDGTALMRVGRHSREVELKDIEGIVLRGRKGTDSTGSGKHRRTYPVYWCEVELTLPGPDAVILTTRRFREDPERPYQGMLPIVVGLARALGVPFRWEEYP